MDTEIEILKNMGFNEATSEEATASTDTSKPVTPVELADKLHDDVVKKALDKFFPC